MLFNDTEVDYYHGIYTGFWKRFFPVLGWLFTEVFGNGLLLMVVDIELDLQFRTILNCIYTSIIKILLLLNIFVVNLEILRVFWGPLNFHLCLLNLIIRNNFEFQLQLLFSETFLFRAIFLGVWQNTAYFNEELVSRFISLLNLTISAFFQFAMLLSNDIYKDIKVRNTFTS